MEDLKARAVRGGFAKLCGQAGNLALRRGFLVIKARLLDPKDYGLVAMVTVVTGVYGIFTSAGLSLAAIQKVTVINEQRSFGSTFLWGWYLVYCAWRRHQFSLPSIMRLAFS
jgi:O-antigen/teichoic acid export membrane protein